MFGWEIKSKLHGWPAKFRNINQLEGSFPSSRLFVHMMLCDEALGKISILEIAGEG